MKEEICCVVTTIQSPTPAVRAFSELFSEEGIRFVVVGDKKGPEDFVLPGVDFFSLAAQNDLPWRLAELLPKNHYTRKNLGYLIAISGGCSILYETDDDNAPSANWKARTLAVKASEATVGRWLNVYRLFSPTLIWPRGFPLEEIVTHSSAVNGALNYSAIADAPIQQGLADGSPDVDAIWRMTLDTPIEFDRRESVRLLRGVWCPFNSQSTWWWPAAFPLLYLPSYCPFRMTDIWRSFIAQRCIWELGAGVVFHSSEVFQERNVHNLLHDFADEVPGYLNNNRIAESLLSLSLLSGQENVAGNLFTCYKQLVAEKFFPPDELILVEAWLQDFVDAKS